MNNTYLSVPRRAARACQPAPLASRWLLLALWWLLPGLALAQAPTLTALSPFIGQPGSVLTLTGTNLTGTTTITFAGAAGPKTVTAGFMVVSSTRITGVVVPAGAQSGPVRATTASGTSAVAAGVAFTRATSLATGSIYTVAVQADGSLWAWGTNGFGQLGQDNKTRGYTSPTRVGTGNGWVSAAAGNYHTMAVQADGSLWAWGDNTYGQLGQGNKTQLTSPTRVGTGTGWVIAAAGSSHTVAVQADGSLWAWGDNTYGQLGQGNKTQLTSPTRVGTGTSWVSAAAGSSHTVAVQANGSLWAWGYNDFGQLGQGNKTQLTSPTRVGMGTDWTNAAGTAIQQAEGN